MVLPERLLARALTVNNIVKKNSPMKVKLMPRSEAEECVEKFHESLKTLPPQVGEVCIVEIEG